MAELQGARHAEVLASLSADASLRVQVRGTCMLPVLADGTWVEARASRVYWPGDVLVFLAWDGRLLVHRCIAVYPHWAGWRWVMQADAATRPDAAVRHAHILGRVQGLTIPVRWRLRASFRGGRCWLHRLKAGLAP